jgi:hypothetical protein
MGESEDEVCSEVRRHMERNALLKVSLAQKGIPLDADRPVDVHFVAFTQRDASVLARRLYGMGFLVKLIAPSGSGRWDVEAGARVTPIRILSEEFTKELVQAAIDEDAKHDGWGTAV